MVSTHSRPKAAGDEVEDGLVVFGVSTHSRPKAAGERKAISAKMVEAFQHTAARRRLVARTEEGSFQAGVSTHSRPKAAGP